MHCIWRCEHTKFCVEVLYALYINLLSFIHLFILSLPLFCPKIVNKKKIKNQPTAITIKATTKDKVTSHLVLERCEFGVVLYAGLVKHIRLPLCLGQLTFQHCDALLLCCRLRCMPSLLRADLVAELFNRHLQVTRLEKQGDSGKTQVRLR